MEASLEALRIAYEQVGLPFPDKYEVYDSPFAAIKAMKENYGIEVSSKDFIFGAHDASWLSFYDYLFNVTDLRFKNDNRLEPLITLAQHCGWVLTFDEMVVLTQRPCKISFDEEKRTHSEDDFAIKFPDNTGVAIWHGQRIPDEWIFEKDKMKAEEIVKWPNVDQRRAGCEIMGWATILDELNAEIINKDEDPEVGTLLEVDLPDAGKERFLMVLDPNVGKHVALPVPPEMETALQANAWTYNIPMEVFKPEIRV